jgi:hypothetical protein
MTGGLREKSVSAGNSGLPNNLHQKVVLTMWKRRALIRDSFDALHSIAFKEEEGLLKAG